MYSFFACVVLFCSLAAGQSLPTAKPESVGLSSERLDRIGKTVQRNIDDKRIAGAVTMVVRHGQVAWLKAQGMQDREAGKPMQPDTIFRICSMTKPITSVAVMMLYEQGYFALEDPISKYLPEFKNPRVLVKPATGEPYTIPASHEITIRDLLRHTSGLTYNWNEVLGPMYKEKNIASGLLPYDGTIADNVRNLASLPLLFNPGERFEYSLGVDVLGRLVEVVSGMRLDEFLRTCIFEPLASEELLRPLVGIICRVAERPLGDRCVRKALQALVGVIGVDRSQPVQLVLRRIEPGVLHGGAGLNSTAADYTRFCEMLLEGGKLGNVRILSPKSVELMTHDQLGKIDPDEAFGLGFGIDGVKAPLEELGTPGEYEWGGFYYTGFRIDPKEQMIVVFMAQLHPSGGLRLNSEVNVLAYQAIMESDY